MTLRNTKLFIGFIVLFAFISIGVFGLLQMNHASEMPMANCPYSPNAFSVCSNDFEHINNWHQFSNAVIPFILVLPLLMLGVILYFYNKQNFLKPNQYFYRWKYYLYDKKLNTYDNKIIKWLSLFENSPSLSYVKT